MITFRESRERLYIIMDTLTNRAAPPTPEELVLLELLNDVSLSLGAAEVTVDYVQCLSKLSKKKES